MSTMRFRQAVVAALSEEMRNDKNVIFFGEDVAEAEGPFKTSEGLLKEFGPVRVRPLMKVVRIRTIGKGLRSHEMLIQMTLGL